MAKLSFAEFDKLYQASVEEIWRHWSVEMQVEIARHCVAWAPERIDFLEYLRLSSIRFYKAYESLADSGENTLCDVGGFWGVWPITASKLGYKVAMTEALKYYGDSFTPLFDQIAENGVAIMDYDPFSSDATLSDTFDFVTVMAVIEHYPHSLRVVIENLKRLTNTNGKIFFDVPNIAYWPKRTAMLRGKSPLADIADIYNSEEPFIGHHHEFTIGEIRDLARLGGLKILREEFYNYSLAARNKLKILIRHPILSAALALSPHSRECIAILCEKK